MKNGDTFHVIETEGGLIPADATFAKLSWVEPNIPTESIAKFKGTLYFEPTDDATVTTFEIYINGLPMFVYHMAPFPVIVTKGSTLQINIK